MIQIPLGEWFHLVQSDPLGHKLEAELRTFVGELMTPGLKQAICSYVANFITLHYQRGDFPYYVSPPDILLIEDGHAINLGASLTLSEYERLERLGSTYSRQTMSS